MSQRAEELADRFERMNEEMIAFVEACTDEQWQRVIPGEKRTVGVVAHHVASAYPAIMRWVMSLAAGKPIEMHLEEIDQANELHAARHGSPSKGEVADLLRTNGAAAAQEVRAISDAQLDQTAHVELSAQGPLSARQMIRHVLIGHAENHLAELRQGLAQ
jgi:hypothetical protein